MFTVQWCEWEKIINKTFIPLNDNKDRYIICKGGRGSSKSDWAAKKLLYRCLTDDFFRCILVRNTYGSIKDSSYQNLKDTIYSLGLEELFVFKIQPLEIHCLNGNSFIARGCDDTTKLKSIKDASCVWYEEDIPSESDFITITTSIRTLKASYLQEIFTINPEVEGNYQDHWFWKRFFKDKPVDATFSDVTKLKINDDITVDLSYTVHHSTYKDNKWIPNEFIAFLMDLKTKNTYYWEVYCKGSWGNKQLGGRFYKNFDLGKNTFNYQYKPELPLHISFDFNVNPYVSLSVWQQEGKRCYLINEIAMEYPKNRTIDACREFTRLYNSHKAGLFVYGDPAGRQEGTRTEAGHNDFKIIQNELEKFRPVLRLFTTQPPVKTRGDFINSIFQSNFDDCMIFINENSVYLKNDLLFGLEDSDGTKLKQKVKGEDGRSYEKHHHFSDNMDYYICYTLNESFNKFQNGMPNTFGRKIGNAPINVKHRL